MKIPPKADKWIVFVGMFGVAVADYPRGPGLPFEPIMGCVLTVSFAMLFMVAYITWSAVFGWVARRFLNAVNVGHIRVFANGLFFLGILLAIFLPGHTGTVTVRIPAHSESAVHPAQDTSSHQP
jgi:hypothetical protein